MLPLICYCNKKIKRIGAIYIAALTLALGFWVSFKFSTSFPISFLNSFLHSRMSLTITNIVTTYRLLISFCSTRCAPYLFLWYDFVQYVLLFFYFFLRFSLDNHWQVSFLYSRLSLWFFTPREQPDYWLAECQGMVPCMLYFSERHHIWLKTLCAVGGRWFRGLGAYDTYTHVWLCVWIVCACIVCVCFSCAVCVCVRVCVLFWR